MSKLRNTGYAGVVTTGAYLGIDQLGKMGSETARDIHAVMKAIKDTVVDTSMEVLSATHTYIGSDAPLSYFGIQQLAGKIGDIYNDGNLLWGMMTLGVSALGTIAGGKIDAEVSEKLNLSTSQGDKRVAQGTLGFTAAGLLLQIPEVLNAGALGGAYLISRKLGEKIIGERYSQLVGGSGAMALASVMHNGSFISNPDLFSLTSLGLGTAAALGKLKNG